MLDDQDLLARTYLRGKVKKIDRCLYIYHHHDNNTCRGTRNAAIQKETLNLHDKYIEPLVSRWSDLNGLRRVDLGTMNRDLLGGRWPFEDGQVGLFIARDLLCKLPEPVHVMEEAYRCLAPNGWFLTDTPSTDGRGAFQDPRHVSFWNSNSFWYYTREPHVNFVGTKARFQLNRFKEHFPSPWHESNKMAYVRADLLKFSGRGPGLIEFGARQGSASLPATGLPATGLPATTAPKPPKFTLLTPTIERSELVRCCRSVNQQTYPHWQHIVILDGADWSISIKELEHPNRVFLVSGMRHHDVGNAARHLAYDHIDGDYVIGLDDDNYLLHNQALKNVERGSRRGRLGRLPHCLDGPLFFSGSAGRGRTDLAQMVYRPVIGGEQIRFPRVPDYDADGILCERLKKLCPPRMLTGVGPLVMYERANGLLANVLLANGLVPVPAVVESGQT